MSSEITLYDASGRPTAYIVPKDGSIYLWSGKPVAYLHNEHVYGFNGRHLGWFEDGIIWAHDGTRAGFTSNTLPVFAQFEPFKAFKQFQPFKGFQQFAPFKPFKSTAVTAIPLANFLDAGR
jgi:hypothetical protein